MKALEGRAISQAIVDSWPKPNYINPVERTWFSGYAISLQVLTTIIVGLRLWARFRRDAGRPGVDDLLIVFAWVSSILLTTVFVTGVMDFGISRHIWDNPPMNSVPALFIGWLSSILFLVVSGLMKISNLLFYRRMGHSGVHKAWMRTTWAAIAFCALYMVVFSLLVIFDCFPVEAAWERFNPLFRKQYHCHAQGVSGPLVGAFSVITDILAAVLPAFLFWNLKMPKREKWALWGIFGVGFLTAAAGVARTFWLGELYNNPKLDLTWTTYNIFVWSQTEIHLGMIAACLPSLKPFFTKFLTRSRLQNYSNRLARFSPSSRKGAYGWNGGSSIDTDSMSVKALKGSISRPISRDDHDGYHGGGMEMGMGMGMGAIKVDSEVSITETRYYDSLEATTTTKSQKGVHDGSSDGSKRSSVVSETRIESTSPDGEGGDSSHFTARAIGFQKYIVKKVGAGVRASSPLRPAGAGRSRNEREKELGRERDEEWQIESTATGGSGISSGGTTGGKFVEDV